MMNGAEIKDVLEKGIDIRFESQKKELMKQLKDAAENGENIFEYVFPFTYSVLANKLYHFLMSQGFDVCINISESKEKYKTTTKEVITTIFLMNGNLPICTDICAEDEIHEEEKVNG